MISEKYKIRLSTLANEILLYDCKQFGFTSKQNNANMNGLLNRIIPNLMRERKNKKSQFIEELESYNLILTSSMIDSVISSINSVWFNDDELNQLDVNVWLRPQAKNNRVFSELEESEAKKYGMGASEFIRNLINEYVRLPEYARFAIAFKTELEYVNESIDNKFVLEFDYENEHIRLNTMTEIYGFNKRHNHFVFGVNRKSSDVEVFRISKMKNTFISEKKFRLKPEDSIKFKKTYEKFKKEE